MDLQGVALFEYKQSRREIELDPSTCICSVIQATLREFGIENASVSLGGGGRSEPGQFMLQRWSNDWGMYVDVQCTDEIQNRDKLTVVSVPSISPTPKVGYGTTAIL